MKKTLILCAILLALPALAYNPEQKQSGPKMLDQLAAHIDKKAAKLGADLCSAVLTRKTPAEVEQAEGRFADIDIGIRKLKAAHPDLKAEISDALHEDAMNMDDLIYVADEYRGAAPDTDPPGAQAPPPNPAREARAKQACDAFQQWVKDTKGRAAANKAHFN